MKNKIALSVDVEDWYHTPLFVGAPNSKYKTLECFFESYERRYDYITEPIKRVLALFDKFHIKATFFIVADICFHYPKIIELLSKSDHEIACHGRYHFQLYDPTTQALTVGLEQFENMTREAKSILENMMNKPIYGYRAPMGYINLELLKTLQSLGFKYDSSMSFNSFYRKTGVVNRSVTTRPEIFHFGERKKNNVDSEFMEMPWSYYNFLGLRIPTAGGFFMRTLGKGIISLGLRQSLKRGDTMLYFHALDICREEFPVKSTNARPFYWYKKGEKTESMLIELLENYSDKFTTCSEIYWRNSENHRVRR